MDGLGLDFRGEAEAAAEVIQASPQRWSLRADGARSYLVHRFPFAIIFLDFAVKNLDCRRDPPSPPAWLLENSAVANRTTDRDCFWGPNHTCVVEGTQGNNRLARTPANCYVLSMSYLTVEVELDHGHVSPKGAEALPEKASGLLTILAPPPLMCLRPIGLAKGQFTVPDDFNAPLPEDVLQTFEGK